MRYRYNYELAIYPLFPWHHYQRVGASPDSDGVRGASQADDHRLTA
jgi:hypothetical protein